MGSNNNIPLTRQSSVYSLTFDEFQSAVGGSSKDLGSMNMDELLKNIWTAEENQNLSSTSGGVIIGQESGNVLQKQGSLTLPRTLSQKTVEEVWRDMAKMYENVGGNDASTSGASNFGVPQRQPTLGEVTLEEFLVRAGVVREEAQMAVKTNNLGFFGDLPNPTLENVGLGFGFQRQEGIKNAGMVGNNLVNTEDGNRVTTGMSNPASNINTSQQQPIQILPKQPGLVFGGPMGIPSTSPRVRNLGISDQVANNNSMVRNGALGPNGIGNVTMSSPLVSSDGLSKNNNNSNNNSNNGDTSTVSPIPYMFNGGVRGRKSAALEKVIERRQRRMIKNRESAARSRARKQAYTMELEAEIAKLKEENEELHKIQAEMMEMQKNQVLEMMKQQQNGPKRQCLRRTQTGPW